MLHGTAFGLGSSIFQSSADVVDQYSWIINAVDQSKG